MGQGARIEIFTHCPLTPSSKRSLIPQGIKKRLNLHFRPNPILVVVSLGLILMASSLAIIWMLVPIETILELNHPMGVWLHGEFLPGAEEYEVARLIGFVGFLAILLGGGWKLLSKIIEFWKTTATSTIVGEERIVE